MSNEIDQAAAGGMVNLFLMNEFRDLRKGMENRDETLRSSIDGVRESVNVLTAKVDRSQGDVDAMRTEVEGMRAELHVVRDDVDGLKQERSEEQIKNDSAWLGPKKIIKTLTFVGGGAGALFVLFKFWPAVLAFMAAVV